MKETLNFQKVLRKHTENTLELQKALTRAMSVLGELDCQAGQHESFTKAFYKFLIEALDKSLESTVGAIQGFILGKWESILEDDQMKFNSFKYDLKQALKIKDQEKDDSQSPKNVRETNKEFNRENSNERRNEEREENQAPQSPHPALKVAKSSPREIRMKKMGNEVVKHFGVLFNVFDSFKLMTNISSHIDIRHLLPPTNGIKIESMNPLHPLVLKTESKLGGSYLPELKRLLKLQGEDPEGSPFLGPYLYKPTSDANQGALEGTYHGQYFNGLRHGIGRFVDNFGNLFEGFLSEDRGLGHGRFIGIEGVVYRGEFRDNIPHGYGEQTFADGGQYKGFWFNGITHGKGEYLFASGALFKGEWFYGNRHGEGVYVKDGTTRIGVWKNGKHIKWL